MVINPDSPIDGLIPYLSQLDLVLLMTVFPGFGGKNLLKKS